MSDDNIPHLTSDDDRIDRIILAMTQVIRNAPDVRLGLKNGTVIDGKLHGVDGENNGDEDGVWAFGCIITVKTKEGDLVPVDALEIELVDKLV